MQYDRLRSLLPAASVALLAVAGCSAGEPKGVPESPGSADSEQLEVATSPQGPSWGAVRLLPGLDWRRLCGRDSQGPPATRRPSISYDGTPAVIVEYHPGGYADAREEVFAFDYAQGGGADEWPSFGEGAIRSVVGDDSFGNCSFILPSSPEGAYVMATALLDPGNEPYCEVASKVVNELSAAPSTAGEPSAALEPPVDSGPTPTSGGTVLEGSFKSVDGYSFDYQYEGLSIATTTDVANQKPGEAQITVVASVTKRNGSPTALRGATSTAAI